MPPKNIGDNVRLYRTRPIIFYSIFSLFVNRRIKIPESSVTTWENRNAGILWRFPIKANFFSRDKPRRFQFLAFPGILKSMIVFVFLTSITIMLCHFILVTSRRTNANAILVPTAFAPLRARCRRDCDRFTRRIVARSENACVTGSRPTRP